MKTHRFVDPTPATRACPRGCMLDQHQPACADQQCPGCLPRPCTPGRWLCPTCHTRLRRDLDRLPRLYDELEWMLHRHTPGLGHRVSGGETPLYVAEPVVEWRHQIAKDVRWWTLGVAVSRGVHPPSDASVRACCRFLAVHLDWATAQSWAHALAEVMGGLADRAYGLAYPARRYVIQRGMPDCPESDCPGTLIASGTATDDLLPPEVVCSVDGAHVVPWVDVLRLRKRLKDVAARLKDVAA